MAEQYPKDVKVVFKNFPLRNHNMALPAAIAAMAAHQQGKFWEFHDEVFKVYNRMNDKTFSDIAQQLGLDTEQFEKDRKDPGIQRKIQQDMQHARPAGVRGTPAVYVNGLQVKDRSLGGFKRMIDAELSRAK